MTRANPHLAERLARITVDSVRALARQRVPLSVFGLVVTTVLATGYMVGLMEWACIEQLLPFYEDGEGSLGTHVDVSHLAPTPPGLTVTVETEVTGIDGKFVWFSVRAHDGVDLIGEGRHQRALVRWEKFVPRVMAKAEKAVA